MGVMRPVYFGESFRRRPQRQWRHTYKVKARRRLLFPKTKVEAISVCISRMALKNVKAFCGLERHGRTNLVFSGVCVVDDGFLYVREEARCSSRYVQSTWDSLVGLSRNEKILP